MQLQQMVCTGMQLQQITFMEVSDIFDVDISQIRGWGTALQVRGCIVVSPTDEVLAPRLIPDTIYRSMYGRVVSEQLPLGVISNAVISKLSHLIRHPQWLSPYTLFWQPTCTVLYYIIILYYICFKFRSILLVETLVAAERNLLWLKVS